MMVEVGYLKRWVKKTLIGLGALKGAPCTIKNIVQIPSPIDPTEHIANKVTFKWTATDGVTTEESTMTVNDGRSIYNVEYDPAGSTAEHLRYVITFLDGSTDDFYIPVSAGSLKKKVVPYLPDAQTADRNTIYLVPIAEKPGCYQQWIVVENELSHLWEWLSLGTTEVDFSEYQKKIDENIEKDYPNYDPGTKAAKPTVPNVVGAINEFNREIGANYDYTHNNIANLETLHKDNLVDAVNEIGYLPNLEFYDDVTQTPNNLVDAINIAHADYSLDADITVDRSKYVDVLRLHKDTKDGSPIVQKGDTDYAYRVDIEKQTTPDMGDYRTYNLKMGNDYVDPKDSAAKPFGEVHIPTVRLVKVETPTVRTTDRIHVDATEWVTVIPDQKYAVTKDLSMNFAPEQTTVPEVRLDPIVTSVTVSAAPTSRSKQAEFVIQGTYVNPFTTDIIYTYDGINTTLDAEYYLDIEGLGYDSTRCGAKIQIAKDMLLHSATVEECVIPGVPLPQLNVGDKFIDLAFELADGSLQHAYIACKDLFDPYVALQAIRIDYDTVEKKNVIRLIIYDPETNEALVQTNDGLRIMNSSETQFGVSKFATDAEVLEANSSVKKTVTPYDIYHFVNDSESVKNDLNGLYVDPVTGEKINKTVIDAINELATEEIVKLLPDDGDIATYSLMARPSDDVRYRLGDKIHDVKTIYHTNSLIGVVNPKDYFIYYLTQDEGANIAGLYMYIAPTGWVRVGGGDAIVRVTELPEENIRENCFYELQVNDTVNGVFSLTDAAKEEGYYVTTEGIYISGYDTGGVFGYAIFDTDVYGDDVAFYPWDVVYVNWVDWYNVRIVDNLNGNIYSVTHSDGITELVYRYKEVSNKLYYYYIDQWIEVSPVLEDKIIDADKNLIMNIDADELKPQDPKEKGKTFVVQDDGTWKLSAAGGVQIVEELPEFDDALDGVAYYLIKRNNDYDVGTYAVHTKDDDTKEWIIVGMENENAYKSLNKISDYMYAVEYDDIDYDYAREYLDEIRMGGCTSIRTPRYMGRNLDWLYDNTVEFIVKTPARGNKHAVIGMTATYKDMTKDVVERGGYNPRWKFVPFTLVDGMNDTGLTVSVNVRPMEDDDVPTTGTNPSVTDPEHQMNASMIPRWILDNYSEDDYYQAFYELINHYNIYVSEKFHEMKYEPQYLIGTYYVYFENNELKFEEIYIEDCNVMTNFGLNNVTFTDDPEMRIYDVHEHTRDSEHAPSSLGITSHGSGLERFNLACRLLHEYKHIMNEYEMRFILTSLRYSLSYRKDSRLGDTADPEWLTEAVGINGLTVDSLAPEFEETEELMRVLYENRDRDNPQVWHTTHMSVYDTSNLTAYFVSQENTDTACQMKLNSPNRKEIQTIYDNEFNFKREQNTLADDVLYVVKLYE